MSMNLQKDHSTTDYDNEFGIEVDKHLRAILYLDDTSRLKIKTNVSEIGLYGISFINNFSELTKELISDQNINHSRRILQQSQLSFRLDSVQGIV